MRFRGAHRIIDMLRPGRKAVGMRFYLMARWRLRHPLLHRHLLRGKWHRRQAPRQIGGVLPGRWHIAGLQAMRRVIEPAVRFQPVTRQYNEIVRRRRKQGAYPPPYLWAKRHPKKHHR